MYHLQETCRTLLSPVPLQQLELCRALFSSTPLQQPLLPETSALPAVQSARPLLPWYHILQQRAKMSFVNFFTRLTQKMMH